MRDCADDHVHMRRVLCELREAVLEQVGEDQTDRLRDALADAARYCRPSRMTSVCAPSGAQSGRVGLCSLRELQLPQKRLVARIARSPRISRSD